MNRKRVTIQDVAEAAGVSRQTVSRAINELGEISPETRAHVLRIAEEMGYRPSSIARGLATQHTGTLGLIVPDVANPFFSEVARGAEHQAYAKGYNVFLCNTDEDPQREVAVLRSLEDKRVDGVVLCSSRLDEATLRAALTNHSSVVLINRQLRGNDFGAVMIDDKLGGQTITQHLLRAGHQAIGFLTGPPASRSGRKRVEGFLATLMAVGVPYQQDWLLPCAPTVEGGQEAALALLTHHPELTALFCYNDLVAVGALQAAAELRRAVPDDLAIAGFDDIPLAALVTPPLTTCRVCRYDMGAQAMGMLLERIAGCTDECQRIVVTPELIIRASAP
ncbi:MAG TPA: LacI family DNA-binding transcriptional regulator [Anaerolineae bacterium]|nr:LacI family DNA-binding transcriptional regulator [Anaerolineae bacterium]HQI86276.1 LacI family DNA-binding transcriptional regulator [Anaerolineae bacterium]